MKKNKKYQDAKLIKIYQYLTQALDQIKHSSWITSISEEDLKDISKELMLKLIDSDAYSKILENDTEAHCINYTKRSLINSIKDFLSNNKTIPIVEYKPEIVFITNDKQTSEINSKLHQIISSLSKSEQNLIRMRYFESMDFSHIAMELEMSYEATLKLHQRVKEKLLEKLRGKL